jgi:hypothetical protein
LGGVKINASQWYEARVTIFDQKVPTVVLQEELKGTEEQPGNVAFYMF